MYTFVSMRYRINEGLQVFFQFINTNKTPREVSLTIGKFPQFLETRHAASKSFGTTI